jgi:hypothetical protein
MIGSNITAAILAERLKRTLPLPFRLLDRSAREWNSQLGYLITFALEKLSARQPTAISEANGAWAGLTFARRAPGNGGETRAPANRL